MSPTYNACPSFQRTVLLHSLLDQVNRLGKSADKGRRDQGKRAPPAPRQAYPGQLHHPMRRHRVTRDDSGATAALTADA